jgi:hypothetical protein
MPPTGRKRRKKEDGETPSRSGAGAGANDNNAVNKVNEGRSRAQSDYDHERTSQDRSNLAYSDKSHHDNLNQSGGYGGYDGNGSSRFGAAGTPQGRNERKASIGTGYEEEIRQQEYERERERDRNYDMYRQGQVNGPARGYGTPQNRDQGGYDAEPALASMGYNGGPRTMGSISVSQLTPVWFLVLRVHAQCANGQMGMDLPPPNPSFPITMSGGTFDLNLPGPSRLPQISNGFQGMPALPPLVSQPNHTHIPLQKGR